MGRLGGGKRNTVRDERFTLPSVEKEGQREYSAKLEKSTKVGNKCFIATVLPYVMLKTSA